MKLWDIESDVLIKEFNTETEVGSACVSPSGELMAYSDIEDDVNYSSVIYVYETNNFKKLKSEIYHKKEEKEEICKLKRELSQTERGA